MESLEAEVDQLKKGLAEKQEQEAAMVQVNLFSPRSGLFVQMPFFSAGTGTYYWEGYFGICRCCCEWSKSNTLQRTPADLRSRRLRRTGVLLKKRRYFIVDFKPCYDVYFVRLFEILY